MTDDTLPNSAPAPWQLRGRGYLLALRMPDADLAACPFTPTSLRDSLHAPLSLAMLVDYTESPVGPYQELLYIPGTFDFQGERHPSITRIYVSTQASVLHGRRNWGIPKDRCDFDIRWQDGGYDEARLTADDGRQIARLTLAGRGPALPVSSRLVPAALRTLSQPWEGRRYTLAPGASGKAQWARVIDWSFSPEHFPDLARGRCVAALRIPSFEMTFPVPEIGTWPG